MKHVIAALFIIAGLINFAPITGVLSADGPSEPGHP